MIIEMLSCYFPLVSSLLFSFLILTGTYIFGFSKIGFEYIYSSNIIPDSFLPPFFISFQSSFFSSFYRAAQAYTFKGLM